VEKNMKIGLIQINNTLDISKNIETIIKSIETEKEVSYFVLAENALTGYTSEPSELNTINLEDDRLLSLKNYCHKNDIHLFVGAALKLTDGYYNSYLYIHKTIQIYHKTHLGLREKRLFKAGDELNVFQTEAMNFGTCICIESHMPDIAQTYALKGAECLLMPFASPSPCGSRKDIWEKYLPARAYDNGLYVIAINMTGALRELTYSGGLMVINPKGQIIMSYFGDEETIRVVDLEKEQVEARKIGKTNYLNRRRKELYEEA